MSDSRDTAPRPEEPLALLADLHAEIEREAARLARRHGGRLKCHRGCFQCCVDDITVFDVEAERIRSRHARLLARGDPHPVGACAFLDHEGACRIYEDRPYVCRTQGLPLRWTEQDDHGQAVELRDVCPLNEVAEEPLEQLSPSACWTIGPFESRLARLQIAFGGSPPKRSRLRDLFTR